MKAFLKFGCAGIVGVVVLIVIISVVANPSKGTTVTGGTSPSKAETPAKIGDTITSGNWKYTVSKATREKTIKWSDFGNQTEAKGVWQIVHVKLENVGKETALINTWDFEVKDAAGITYKADTDSVSYSSYNKLSKPMDNYPPGVPAEIGLVFDVNPSAKGLKLWLVQAKAFVELGQ